MEAREVMKEMQQGEVAPDEDEEDGEDLAASVARWMAEQDSKGSSTWLGVVFCSSWCSKKGLIYRELKPGGVPEHFGF